MYVLSFVCLLVLLLGVRGVGGLDQGEELHLGSSGLWKGPEQCPEVTTETQDSGWGTTGSPVTAAGVCACVLFISVCENQPLKYTQYLKFLSATSVNICLSIHKYIFELTYKKNLYTVTYKNT